MKFVNLLYFLLFVPTSLIAQQSIKATFSPAEHFNWAILYKTSPTRNIYIAQSKIDEGKLEFLLDSSATKGIYKLVYAAPQEDYNFDIIYNGEEDIELTFNINTGVVFQKSSENIMLNSYLNSLAVIGTEIEKFYIEKNQDTLVLISLFEKQKIMQKEFEDKSNNTLSNHFIKANKPYIPKNYETPETYINHLTTNYFANIDFKDSILQSSNFLTDRSLAYILGVTHEGLDEISSYHSNIDTVSSQLKVAEPNYQKALLENLWQKLINYDLVESANYLAAKHLIPLAEKLEDELLVIKLTQFKNLSIGNVAPDFSWEVEAEAEGKIKTHKLSELALAENYILVFWSSGCSHCLKEIPKLKLLVQSLESTKYKVIAIGLEEDNIKWEMEIKKYPEFINVLKLNKWENEIITTYGLTTTPTYFVLDKDKRFLAKPESFEDLKLFLEK